MVRSLVLPFITPQRCRKRALGACASSLSPAPSSAWIYRLHFFSLFLLLQPESTNLTILPVPCLEIFVFETALKWTFSNTKARGIMVGFGSRLIIYYDTKDTG